MTANNYNMKSICPKILTVSMIHTIERLKIITIIHLLKIKMKFNFPKQIQKARKQNIKESKEETLMN